ncbi:DUF2793 domain-containing protein [Sphingomonas sp.]|uniref:DUF2793 domain-containing protein n=1 Tax=Sphingomonas sp. TaxID=28214 RepID=UPI00289878FF|nr:DUF2793 domain-containing protein [Sphingomonas sp.]
MTDATPNWALPFLAAGQAQKELTHNEALTLIDLLAHPCVEAVGVDAPPAAPIVGQAWIVGGQPTEAWTGRAWMLAAWTDGGWRFVGPRIGMAVWSRGDRHRCDWDGEVWRHGLVPAREIQVDGKKVVGAQQPAIVPPYGGQVVDSEARLALDAVIGALRAHGLLASA